MLGISAIGWKDEEEEQILSANAGAFNVLEIVPARIFAQNKDSNLYCKTKIGIYNICFYLD